VKAPTESAQDDNLFFRVWALHHHDTCLLIFPLAIVHQKPRANPPGKNVMQCASTSTIRRICRMVPSMPSVRTSHRARGMIVCWSCLPPSPLVQPTGSFHW